MFTRHKMRISVCLLVIATACLSLAWAVNDHFVVGRYEAKSDESMTSQNEADPNGPAGGRAYPKAVGDCLWECDAETQSGDNQLLGVEFDGTNYIVSGGGGGTDPNYVYLIDQDCQFVSSFAQFRSAGWGWRDIAFDGTYLYASDDGSNLTQFDAVGNDYGDITLSSFGGSTIRAVACDPVGGKFYVADWATDIYEYPMTGGGYTAIHPTATGGKYGLAYDPRTNDLYIFSQDGSGVDVYQYDLDTDTEQFLFAGCPADTNMAGGLAFLNAGEWPNDPMKYVLVAMHQQSPNDLIHVYEIDVYEEEWPNHKMHFPQEPDLIGWDVNATYPIILADDWQCSETGWVTDIHFWGSWKDQDGIPETDDIGVISYFIFSIHSNLPVGHPDNPYPYSIPGPQVWGAEEWLEGTPHDPPTLEAWYDPTIPLNVPNDHVPYWRYDFVEIPDPFYQLQDSIYWLDISAVLLDPLDYQWGWKTSRDHFMDDAVWTEPGSPWIEMYEPPRTNFFSVTFNEYGEPGDSGSTNYYGNGWYYYETYEWWNMWFYDNPFTYENYKEIYITFDVIPLGATPFIYFALNWSTDIWSLEGEPGRPPLPSDGNEDLYIGRQEFEVYPEGHFEFPWTLTYNPEWVSIDFRAMDVWIYNGIITHECVQTSMDMAFVITGEPAEVYDFGDAPDTPYCTKLASNGARHQNLGGVFEWLGDINEFLPGGCSVIPKVSLEQDATDLFDPDGEPNLNPEDTDHWDDGVLFYPPYNYCEVESVDVLVSTSGLGAARYQAGQNLLLHLRAWFDWNQDGDWVDTFTCTSPGDAPEHVIWLSAECLGPDPQAEVAVDLQRFTMDPSTWASSCRLYRMKFLAGQGETGDVWSRFRLNFCEPDNDSTCGMAACGEVEDYSVQYEGEVIEEAFIRADADADMDVEMSDAIFTLKYLYVPGSPIPDCMDAADSDDGGSIEMSDAIYTLKYLYVPGSPAPPDPGPTTCGDDPTFDGLDCADHPCMGRGVTGVKEAKPTQRMKPLQ